jgi:dienelactone hydrolase
MERTEYRLPSSGGVLIPGSRGRIFAQLYLPEGLYPAPAVVLCHGIPGNERIMDFAVSLREAGFCALHFHYGGSWGSDGSYSITGCFEDTMSVLEWVGRNEQGLFDLSRVFVCGHSLGGMMACRAIACSDLVRGGVVIMPMNGRHTADGALSEVPPKGLVDFYGECAPWLRDFGWETVVRDVHLHPDWFPYESYAPAMAEKPVLTIAGSRDTLLPREQNVDVLNALIRKEGKGLLQSLTFDCDHGMNMHRGEIKACVAEFLRTLC